VEAAATGILAVELALARLDRNRLVPPLPSASLQEAGYRTQGRRLVAYLVEAAQRNVGPFRNLVLAVVAPHLSALASHLASHVDSHMA